MMDNWIEQLDEFRKILEKIQKDYEVALAKLDTAALDKIHEERKKFLRMYDRAYVLADLQRKGDVEALKRGW